MADVFVSYSRRDSDFVGRVVRSIEEGGKEVWLDTEGIVDGEVFPPAIRRAIEQADTFLFVITPAAVESPFCASEVDHASDLHKRIVPVLREPVPDDQLPAEIRDRNWIPFTERERVVRRFARGQNATAGGSGLGLAIVQAEARRHGGTLELTSSELGGLLARVTIRS